MCIEYIFLISKTSIAKCVLEYIFLISKTQKQQEDKEQKKLKKKR